MNAGVLDLIRLVHRVSGFLADLPADRLTALVKGAAELTLVPAGSAAAPTLHSGTATPEPPRAAMTAGRARAGEARADCAEIAQKLRTMETRQAAMTYLTSLDPRVVDLVTIGELLGADMPRTPRKQRAFTLVVDQAVGARTKFAGLAF